MNIKWRAKASLYGSVSAVVALAFVPQNAQAQVAEQNEDSVVIEEIITIGTRVKGRTATETAVPVDVIDIDAIEDNGFTELGQLLQALAPSFNFSRTQISDGSDLFRPATLRGLGPDQVLVLVNGKRRHQRSVISLSGTVGEGATGTDFNAIPAAAIGRIEILRDGAAAQYGSDAIAGVVNLVLKDSAEGGSASAQAGQTYAGDGENYQFSGNLGFGFGDDTYFNLTAEYRNGEPTNRADISQQLGDVRFQIGDPDSEAVLLFLNGGTKLGDSAEFYFFGGWSENRALGAGFYRFPNNPARAIPQVFPEGFLPRDLNRSVDGSGFLGIRGDFSDTWSYDFSSGYGRNDYSLRVRNAPNVSIASAFVAANPDAAAAEIAANLGPTEGFSGSIEFGQWTSNIDINGELDVGLASPLYVAFGAEYRDEEYVITEGQLESYSCGLSPNNAFIPSILNPDTAANCGFQAFPGFRPETAGKSTRDSFALYVDFESNLTDWLLVGLAGRYEDYGNVGDKFTGKATTRIQVADNFALRGAISTGFRAPSLAQLSFTTVTTNATAAGLTQQLLTPVGSAFPAFFGVDNLDIETSNNYSAGFVWEPFDNVTVTLDAFLIKIDDRIVLGSAISAGALDAVPAAQQFLIDNGIGAANFFSNAVDTETKGIDFIVTHNTALGEGTLTSTFAMNLNKTTIDRVNAPTGVDEFLLFPEPSRRFVERGQPRVRLNATFDYEVGPWESLFRLNYYGPTETSFFSAPGLGFPPEAIQGIGLDPSPAIHPGSAIIADLEIGYRITDNIKFAVGANNLFDVRPNELPNNAALRFISDGSTPFGNVRYPLRGLAYGLNGGSYYARLNIDF